MGRDNTPTLDITINQITPPLILLNHNARPHSCSRSSLLYSRLAFFLAVPVIPTSSASGAVACRLKYRLHQSPDTLRPVARLLCAGSRARDNGLASITMQEVWVSGVAPSFYSSEATRSSDKTINQKSNPRSSPGSHWLTATSPRSYTAIAIAIVIAGVFILGEPVCCC